jgi:hypothetical protein
MQHKHTARYFAFLFAALPIIGALWFARPTTIQRAFARPTATIQARTPTQKAHNGQRKEKHMAIYEASGAGDSAFNGYFNNSGTAHGAAAFTNGAKWLWFNGASTWYFSDAIDSDTAFYAANGDASGPTLSGYLAVGLTSPAPTLAVFTPPQRHPAAGMMRKLMQQQGN